MRPVMRFKVTSQMLKKVALNICTELARYIILFLEMNKLLCVSSWNFLLQSSTGLNGEHPSIVSWTFQGQAC